MNIKLHSNLLKYSVYFFKNTKGMIFEVDGQHLMFILKKVLQNNLGVLCIMIITFDTVTRLLPGLYLMQNHKEDK